MLCKKFIYFNGVQSCLLLLLFLHSQTVEIFCLNSAIHWLNSNYVEEIAIVVAFTSSWCFSGEPGYITAHQTMPIKQAKKSLYQVLWYNIPINLKQLYYHTATESLHYLRGAKISWTPTLEGVHLNLASSVFSFACNARSPNHQLFLFFPHKNASQFLKRRSDWLALEGLESPKVTFLGFWKKSYLFRYAFLFQ